MFKAVLLVTAVALLAGCVAGPPTQLEPKTYTTQGQGNVDPARIPVLSDCLVDGFGESTVWAQNTTVRQQRRASSLRVEVMSGVRPVLVVEMLDSGAVTLYDAKISALPTSAERKVLAECMEKFAR